jgi:tetratricopeptide (TPR) repeat protein
MATTQNNLGLLYRQLGRNHQARELFLTTISCLEQLDVDDQTSDLRSRSLAAALSNLSSLTLESDPQESALLLHRAIGQRLESIDQSPNRLQASAEIATIYGNLGSTRLAANDLEGAGSAYESAIDLQP